jgi:hypothetical protein
MKKHYHKILVIVFIFVLYSIIWCLLIPGSIIGTASSSDTPSPSGQQFTRDPDFDRQLNARVSNTLNNIYNSQQVSIAMISDAIQRFGARSPEVKSLTEMKMAQDAINSKTVAELVQRYGWFGPARVGIQNSYTLFATIQNSDLETQAKLLSVMEKAVKEGTLAPEHYASLVDRKALAEHRVQIYGTVLTGDLFSGNAVVAPIVHEESVNLRRQEIGLPPLEEFARANHIQYAACKSGI